MSGTAVPAGGVPSAPDLPGLLPATLLVEPDPDAGTVRIRRSGRDWFVDICCFLIALILWAGFWIISSEEGATGPLAKVDVVVGALSCLALWLRRRYPLQLALVLSVVVGCCFVTGIGALVIALFTVAVHRRFLVAAAVVLLQVALAPLFPLLRPDWQDVLGPLDFIVTGLAAGAILAWGMFVRARRQLVLSLRERAVRAEAEQRLRVAQARQLERARIAREMHDVLAHRISLVSLHAGGLEFRPDAPPAEIASAAGVIRDSAHQALQDLREIIGVLRQEDPEADAPDRPQPTLADLPELVDESRRAGVRVRLDRRLPDLAAVPAGVGRNAYRIVQEALTNARKHGGGAGVEVTVAGGAGDGLTVEVRNPLAVGARPPAIPGTGTGIIGLVERASLAGGRLEHGRTASGDFRIWAWLPWAAQ